MRDWPDWGLEISLEERRREERTHASEPNCALLVVDVHEVEDDSRLEVALNIVDDETFSDCSSAQA